MSNKTQLQTNNTDLQSIFSTVLGLPTQESVKHGAYVWKYKDGKVKDELPSGYTRIGHIVSDGNQWIDTGIIPNSSDFSIKTLIRSTAATSAENWFVTIGHDKTSGSATFLQFGTNASLFAVHLTSVSVGGNTAANNDDVEIDFSVSGNTASLSGDATYTVTNGSFSSGAYRSKSICICDGSWRTYGVQITVGGTLVRNLVPAKNSSGVVGLYDTVGNTFYTSSGTGQFAEGSEPFWTFAGYAVNDNESAYPDGGTQDGYFYEKFEEKLTLEMFGCTKMAVDKFTFSSYASGKTAINHSLGVVPKISFIKIANEFGVPGNPPNSFFLECISNYVNGAGNSSIILRLTSDSASSKSTTYSTSICSASYVNINATNYYYYVGQEYILITMA